MTMYSKLIKIVEQRIMWRLPTGTATAQCKNIYILFFFSLSFSSWCCSAFISWALTTIENSTRMFQSPGVAVNIAIVIAITKAIKITIKLIFKERIRCTRPCTMRSTFALTQLSFNGTAMAMCECFSRAARIYFLVFNRRDGLSVCGRCMYWSVIFRSLECCRNRHLNAVQCTHSSSAQLHLTYAHVFLTLFIILSLTETIKIPRLLLHSNVSLHRTQSQYLPTIGFAPSFGSMMCFACVTNLS